MSTEHMAQRELANFRWMVQLRPLSTRSKMRLELASTPFHSCRKISSKQSLLMGWLMERLMEKDDQRLREPRQMRACSHGKWQGRNRLGLSHGEVVGCPAPGTWVDRCQGRLRRRRMWLLLRLDEW